MIQAKVQVAPKVVQKNKNGIQIYAWGEDNNWPTDAIRLVGNSGTATQCLDLIGRYLMGEGLKYDGDNPTVQFVVDKINKEVLPEVCMNFAFLPMLATNPTINGLGEITDLKPLDNSALRSGLVDEELKTDEWWACGDWPNAKPVFDPKYPERLAIKYYVYKGKQGEKMRFAQYADNLAEWKSLKHIIIDAFKGRGDTIYPTPTWWAGANAIYLDGKSMIFQVDNMDNKFNADVLVRVKENLDGIDEFGRNKRQKVKDDLTEMFTGSSDEGKKKSRFVLVDGVEAPFEVTAIPNNNSHEMYNAIFNTANGVIAKVFGVPKAILNGDVTGSGFSTKQIIDSITLFNNGLYPLQQQIASYFAGIVQNWQNVNESVYLEIVQNNPLSEIPSEVIARMSDEQLFEMYGINTTPNA